MGHPYHSVCELSVSTPVSQGTSVSSLSLMHVHESRVEVKQLIPAQKYVALEKDTSLPQL